MGIADFVTNYGLYREVGDAATRNQNAEDYAQATRGLNLERLKAENALIPEKSAAERARLGLTTTQDTANTGLVAPKAKLEGTNLGTEQAVAEDKQGQLPTFLGMQHDVLRSQADAAKSAAGESGVQLENLPQHLTQMRQANLIDDQKRGMLGLGGLAYAMSSGDHQKALDYVNQSLKMGALGPKGSNTTVATIVPEAMAADGTTKVVRLLDAQGNVVADIPHQSIQAGFNMLSPPVLKEISKGAALAKINPLSGTAETVLTNSEADRYDVKDGIYFDRQGKSTPTKVEGGTHDRLLINDGVQQLAQDFGAKLDPLSKMIDASSIKDPAGFSEARAELARRVGKGEEPMAVARDLSSVYRKKQAGRDASGGNGGYTGPTPWKR